VKASVRRQLASRKRRILRRIKNQPGVERHQPMMTASNIHYEIADRTRAISPGGIGAIHLLAQKLGLVRDINAEIRGPKFTYNLDTSAPSFPREAHAHCR